MDLRQMRSSPVCRKRSACQYAYELYTSGPALLEKVWHRLLTISVEDIGFGDLDAAGKINTLDEMRKKFAYDDGDQPMYFIHAIRILCACTKDRSSDYLKRLWARCPRFSMWL